MESVEKRRRLSDGLIGRYRLLAELAAGGMGSVYLAMARGPAGFSKLVVVKVLRSDLAHDGTTRDSFLQEALLGARLSHPNVVQTLEVVEADGEPFIVMEYLEGQVLSRIAQQTGLLPTTHYIRCICETLKGLHYAHELCDYGGKHLKLIHRDVSPHNVMLTSDGQVKLLDFGIASSLINTVRTETGVLKGKLGYMAPEQMAGETLDRRADIYSVGVMLWEAMTQRHMWKGISEAVVLHGVIEGKIPSPRTVSEIEGDPVFEQICLKALSTKREDRFETAEEMRLALEERLATFSNVPSVSEIATRVSEAFADERRRVREFIDKELSHPASEPPASGTSPIRRLPNLRWTPVPFNEDVPGDETEVTTAEAWTVNTRKRQKWRRVLGYSGAAIGIAAVAIIGRTFVVKPHQVTTSSSVATASSIKSETAAEPMANAEKENRIAIQIAVSPESARFFLDDAPLEGNPHSSIRTMDKQPHLLIVRAPGFTEQRVTLRFDRDVELHLVLEPVVAGAPSSLAATPRNTGPKKVPGPSAPQPHDPPSSGPGAGSPPPANPPTRPGPTHGPDWTDPWSK